MRIIKPNSLNYANMARSRSTKHNSKGWKNSVIGLPPEALLNSIVSGLIPEIRHELAVQKPYTITQAIGLAKQIEAKLKDSKNRPTRPPTSTNLPNSPTVASIYTAPTQTAPKPAPQNAQPINTTNHNPKLQVRWLTTAQMQERRAQGLCYNCDEKYIMGHCCATVRHLLLILEPNQENQDMPEEIEPQDDTGDIYFHLSPQALT